MTAEWALVGLDVGSTTVKGVVVDPATSAVLWSDYVRHETRQPETVLAFLDRIEATLRLPAERQRVLVTGSGGAAIASRLGTHHVQEVTAVAMAVERLHPEAGSVVELGGQDAKIIIFGRDPASGRTSKTMSMNDKCAGGTGAVLDKIVAKLGIRPEQVAAMKHRGVQRHPVAAKCGVFAETDINALQKVGVPADQLLASLFDAIVTQNLSVLARGNTLRPEVLLLGGPNAFVPGLVEAWREHIPRLWAERGVPLPADADPRELVRVPADALYFGALGAVEFGRQLGEGPNGVRRFAGSAPLRHYVAEGRRREISGAGRRGLAGGPEELAGFLARYRPDPAPPVDFAAGSVVEAYVGIDGGSTSTKGVLLAPDGAVLGTAYRLSRGNPIDDARDVLDRLDGQVTDAGATLRVLGVGTTGYAKDVLGEVLRADVALIETVAHARSALRAHPDADVICDVGGQDIKVIVLRDGRVVDFRLNTACSAGNGYFLQAVAGTFGVPVERYADLAFAAERMPTFGYGCAVFLQSDIVDVQRQGWRREEIMAGLAAVLPKNIWLYVAQTPNLAALGRTFVLQGGTQHNLAAVKAQVDYIESRFAGTGVTPRIVVHRHCGEAGAIGAALEVGRLLAGRPSSFVGMPAVRRLTYTSTTGEDTRCRLCRNHCLRTYLHIDGAAGSRRVVVGNGCERGAADEGRPLREINRATAAVRAANPNLAGVAARAVWRAALAGRAAGPVTDPTAGPRHPFRPPPSRRERRRREQAGRRDGLRIGIPRALGLYSANPFFTGYLQALGVPAGNLVYSDFTSDRLYRSGVHRGSIDPCFPSKLGIPHVHDLLTVQHRRRPLDVIFFPMLDALPGDLVGVQARRACPTVTLTPQAVRAAFVKEGDAFAAAGIRYLNPLIDLADERLCAAQLFDAFAEVLGLTRAENDRAVRVGYQVLHRFWAGLRSTAAEVLARLEAEERLGIVVLGRPYHHDPGINHGILDDLQKAGYPVLTQDTLPVDGEVVDRLFRAEVADGAMAHPLDISDVWECSYSENTNRKLWAAKFVARHPNLVAVELSSFKCGHDAPTYAVLAEILEASGTPYLSFRDIDENKPASSIRLRIETITYLLRRYREEVLVPRARARAALDHHLAEYEARLRAALAEGLDSTGEPHERTFPVKAAVVHEFKAPLTLEDRPRPEPGPGQVLVRVQAAGLCHTDIHAAHGDWPVKPTPPFVPGHEGVGVIEALGPTEVETLGVGDRVAVPWLGYTCGQCRYCNDGRETLCERQLRTGYSIDGSYAEYVLGYARNVVKVPDEVDSFDAAPLTCAGVTTYKAVKVSGTRPASLAVVLGIGGLGHLAIQYARIAGAEVVAVDISDERLTTARELGADHVINGAEQDPVAEIKRLGGADTAILTAASPKPSAQAYASLAPGGTLVFVGLPAENEAQIPVFETVLNGITIRGSIVGTHQDLVEVFQLHRLGRTQVRLERRSLDRVNEAITEVLDGTASAPRLVFEL